MKITKGADGSEYVIFPMDRTGFKISKHVWDPDPHMRDTAGFYKRLDISALRSVNWDQVAEKEWGPWWESLFYWPSHRADLIAIPGPPGKTWFEGFQGLLQDGDFDLIAMLKLVLGNGRIYKVGYGVRRPFFETPIGRGSMVIDSSEQRFGFYAGQPFADRPLLGLRWEEGGFALPMPTPLLSWKNALDFRLEAVVNQYFEEVAFAEMEAAFLEIEPDITAFVEGFEIVRWKPQG